MSSKVLLARVSPGESPAKLARKAVRLYQALGVDLGLDREQLVAIKQHFGEGENQGYIRAPVARAFAELITKQGGKPFLTETATLYKGHRTNAVDHLNQAYEHGFTPDAVGCPIVMADGLVGASQVKVRIDKKHYKEVYVAQDVPHTHAMILLSHVTGHVAVGLGGAIKNLGMGLASRAGKLSQHHGTVPLVDKEECVACGTCARWCPADAITVTDIAVIDEKKCIGCGECFSVCPFDAIGFKWQTSSANLQEKIAEHALGAVLELKRRIVCLNFITGVTKGCDCFDMEQEAIIDDVGILTSTDPVALDQATLDLIKRENDTDVLRDEYPEIDPTAQITHGRKIGLGSTDYELVELE